MSMPDADEPPRPRDLRRGRHDGPLDLQSVAQADFVEDDVGCSWSSPAVARAYIFATMALAMSRVDALPPMS